MFVCFFSVMLCLFGCEEGSAPTDNLETEHLNLRIIKIYDTPQGEWNYTISACETDSDCIDIEYIFNHLDLPDINISKGDIILVEVLAERPLPLPVPLAVLSWSMYE